MSLVSAANLRKLFFLHLLYIGLFFISNEGRGVSFVTDEIVDSVLMNYLDFL